MNWKATNLRAPLIQHHERSFQSNQQMTWVDIFRFSKIPPYLNVNWSPLRQTCVSKTFTFWMGILWGYFDPTAHLGKHLYHRITTHGGERGPLGDVNMFLLTQKKVKQGINFPCLDRISLCSSCRNPTCPFLHLLWNTVGGPPCVIIGFLKSVSRLQACQLLAYLWSCPKCERTGWTKTLPLGNIADQQICEGIASDRAVSIAWFKGNKFASGQNISSWKMIADNKDTEKREYNYVGLKTLTML